MIHQFVKSNLLPDFDPEPAADAHGATYEKRIEIVSFRAPEGTRAYLAGRSIELGISTSAFVLSLVDRERNEQAKASKSCLPLETAITELNREVCLALADGRVDSHERARISRPAAWILSWLWPRKIA